MEDRNKLLIDEIKARLLPVFQRTKPRRAYLFGSLSKGTATRKSDIDLMIEIETNKRFFNRYDDFEEIHQIIFDRAVDILIYTPDELSKISHRAFIKNILEKGIIIYEH